MQYGIPLLNVIFSESQCIGGIHAHLARNTVSPPVHGFFTVYKTKIGPVRVFFIGNFGRTEPIIGIHTGKRGIGGHQEGPFRLVFMRQVPAAFRHDERPVCSLFDIDG